MTGETLVAALRAERLRRRVTQADVAERMQVSQSYVAKLETGRHDPRLSTFLRYALCIVNTRQLERIILDRGERE